MSLPIPRPAKQVLKRIVWSMQGLFILGDYFAFKKSSKHSTRDFHLSYWRAYPVLLDKTSVTGFDRHYVYHVSWASRRVKEINPARHVDVGSSLYFSGTLSAFIPVDFYDYRPADIMLSGLRSLRGDLLDLPFKDGEISSLSCMHTLEHVGLGRYGDPIDADGDQKGMRELARSVAPGGNLLIVVPTGKTTRVEFNAHRVYSYDAVVSQFPGFTLKEFAYIPERVERGGIIEHASPADIKDDIHGCGCYWFVKNK